MKRLLFVIFLFSSIIFLGCTNNKLSYDEDVKVSHQYMEKFANTKDPIEYKKLLEQEITHFQEPFFSDEGIKKLRAAILRYNYEFLFFIEETLGNKYQADIYFRKAQYWGLISAECFTGLNPLTPKETIERASRTKEDIVKHMIKLNPSFVKKLKAIVEAEKNKKSK